MTTLSPPYRVIAGRGIVDARDRLVARVEARHAVNTLGMVLYRNEDGTSDPDNLPGLSPTEADAVAHELVRVLNSHTRIVSEARALLNHAEYEDGNGTILTSDAEALESALAGEPDTLDTYSALLDARLLLTDIRDFWAGGDCPPELWARIEAATGAPQRAADAVLKAGMEDDGNA